VASKPREEPRLRWTLSLAAREFGTARETLRRRLIECHEEPGPDACYSTAQLLVSLYGDLDGAKLRTENEKAEKLRIENMVSRGELLSRRELAKGLAAIADAFVSRLMAAERNTSFGQGGSLERSLELALGVRGCRQAPIPASAR
jgi:hypothetical protein